MTDQKKKNQRTIIILALMTIVPFSVAWYLTTDPDFRPGSTNKGDLITPLITTERAELQGIDPFSIKNIAKGAIYTDARPNPATTMPAIIPVFAGGNHLMAGGVAEA